MRIRPSDAIYALLATALALMGAVRWLHEPVSASGFNVVWCAGHVFLGGYDPYLQQPLHVCESLLGTARGPVALPAPQPPYAISLFALVALLPHDVALILWKIALVLATAAVVWSISRLAAMPLWAAAAAIVVPMLVPTSTVLSLPPFALSMVVLGALALRHQRVPVAVALLALGCIQIDMAAPALIATFVAMPRARVPVALAAALAIGISFVVAGPATVVEYVTQVLPAQAAGETTAYVQFSLTSLLATSGVPEHAARMVGELQAIAFTLFGIVAAVLLYRKDRDAAWLALVPAGFAAIGGVYVHTEELAYAIPALALFANVPRASTWARLGMVLLSGPWFWASLIPGAVPIAVAAPFVLMRWAFATPLWASGLICFGLWLCLNRMHDLWFGAFPPGSVAASNAFAGPPPDAPASAGVAALMHAQPNPHIGWLAKFPSVLGGLMLLPASLLAVRRD